MDPQTYFQAIGSNIAIDEDLIALSEKAHVTAIEADGGDSDSYKVLHSRYRTKPRQIANRGFAQRRNRQLECRANDRHTAD